MLWYHVNSFPWCPSSPAREQRIVHVGSNARAVTLHRVADGDPLRLRTGGGHISYLTGSDHNPTTASR